MALKKHEYYLNKKKIQFGKKYRLWKIKNRDYAAWLKNAVNFLFA